MKKDGGQIRGNNSQFEVLKLLHQGLSITEIAKYRKVKRSSIYKVLSTLINKSYVRYPKRSMYEITDKGTSWLHSFVALRYNLRQHNLHFKIKVLESPKNWHLKRNELRQLPFFNRTLKLRNNDQDLFNYGKLQIKTTTRSVIIKLPTLFGVSTDDCVVQAMQILEDSIPKVESLFKIVLVKDYKSNITIISQEYASLQDSLAKLYHQEGNRLYLSGDDGKIWLITDLSFSVDELEFVHSDNASDDVDVIRPFFNDLRKNPTTLSDIRSHIGELQGVVTSWAVNQVKHQKVLDEILIVARDLKDIKKRLESAGL